MRLNGKVAIVTGGSRGIGRATSIALAREGAKIVVVCRNESTCEEVVAQIASGGGTAIAVQADVSREADVAAMVGTAMEHFQRVDILVNNAAVNLPYRAVADLTLDEWNQIVATNLTGPFLCCRAVVPVMTAQSYGKIINMSSRGGRQGEAGRSPYRSTKAALINFTECLAAEVKEFGIDVNAICPGAVATDMMSEITNGNVPSYAMPPEDIASVVVFLASDESSAITGTAIDAFGAGNPLFRGKSYLAPGPR
ncbi:MAG: SDR family oxidoreductase [Dehalococcoidia bacterium]|nr:MAG: SDR family oxidoreductase [Dehalococcoidia bacterium]